MYSLISFFICDTPGFLRVMSFIKIGLNIVRFAVPIIVILMIIIDLYKNVINPNEKEGINKIVKRVVAAIIVFLVPTLVSLVFNLVDKIFDNRSETDYTLSSCYNNADSTCIKKIENYLKCQDILEPSEKSKCQTFRQCNDYIVGGSGSNCSVTTVLNDANCISINKASDGTYDNNYTKFSRDNYNYLKD